MSNRSLIALLIVNSFIHLFGGVNKQSGECEVLLSRVESSDWNILQNSVQEKQRHLTGAKHTLKASSKKRLSFLLLRKGHLAAKSGCRIAKSCAAEARKENNPFLAASVNAGGKMVGGVVSGTGLLIMAAGGAISLYTHGDGKSFFQACKMQNQNK